MLVTFSVADMSSVFVFNRKLTFMKDDLTLNEFFISNNVSVNTIVEIKVGSSLNSLCSVELSCINDILISDFSSYKPCIIHVAVRNLFFSFWLLLSNNCFHILSSSWLLFKKNHPHKFSGITDLSELSTFMHWVWFGNLLLLIKNRN